MRLHDLYHQLSLALGLQPHGTVAAVFEAVQRQVRGAWSEHRIHPVLVVDEAHLMPDATLSHLQVLANVDMDSRPLLSLVLVGLSELQDRMRLGGGTGRCSRESAPWATSAPPRPTPPQRTCAIASNARARRVTSWFRTA